MPKKAEKEPVFAAASHDDWMVLVKKALAGENFNETLVRKCQDGIEIEPLSVAHSGVGAAQKGEPGWEIRQTVQNPRLGQANDEILTDLAGGASSIHLKFNMGRIKGQPGIPLASKDDFGKLLMDVHLPYITISIDSGFHYAAATSALLQYCLDNEADEGNAKIRLNADPLAALARAGELPNDLNILFGEVGGLAKLMSDEWKHVKTVGVDTTVYHLAGVSETQELATALSSGIMYLRVLEKMGLSPDQAADQIVFRMAADCDVFVTIAKFRALRVLWSRVLESCGARSRACEIHGEAAARMMMRRDSANNVLRATAAGFGAAIGGANSIGLLPYTYALGGADRNARRAARNIQNILSEESHLSKIGEAAAGAFAIEKLTRDMAETAWVLMQEIEAIGGISSALQGGLIEGWSVAARQHRNTRIRTGARKIIGVNCFIDESEEMPYVLQNGDGAATTRLGAHLDIFEGEAPDGEDYENAEANGNGEHDTKGDQDKGVVR
jgi:methylmalonyl-CoA mutase